MKQLMLGVTETTGGKYWQTIKNSACSISNNALGSGTDANLCTSQLQVHQSASEGKVVIQYRIKWVRKKNSKLFQWALLRCVCFLPCLCSLCLDYITIFFKLIQQWRADMPVSVLVYSHQDVKMQIFSWDIINSFAGFSAQTLPLHWTGDKAEVSKKLISFGHNFKH